MTQSTKAASSNTVVSGSWTNPTFAYGTTSDDSWATITSTTRNGLFEIRYGFASFTTGDIPDGATINWVRVGLEGHVGGSIGSIVQITIQNPAGTAVGNAASTSNTSDTLIQSTSTTHPTLQNLRDAVVVASVVYDRPNSATSETAYLDYVSITVDYTGVTTVPGSRPADAILKKTVAATSPADAIVKAPITAARPADAIVLRTIGPLAFWSDAFLSRVIAGQIPADAILFAIRAGSVRADAIAAIVQAGLIEADAALFKIISPYLYADAWLQSGGPVEGSVLADASIGVVGPCIWTFPNDGVPITNTPELRFLMPASAGNLWFWLEMDRSAAFDTTDLRRYQTTLSVTDWTYWDGDSWESIPAGGVANIYAGNEARFNVTTSLIGGTWYRRVRAGTR